MHYYALVLIPPDGEPEELVEAVLAPFCDERDGDYNEDGWWDWWQIGGRWSGHLSGYDPETDPANQEVCDVCGGTGTRDWTGTNCTPEWIAECNGCNGCNGTGVRTSWPTQWAMHDGDVMPVRLALAAIEASADKIPYRLVGGEVLAPCEIRNPDWHKGDDWADYLIEVPNHRDTVLDTLRRADPEWRAVVVDYHC